MSGIISKALERNLKKSTGSKLVGYGSRTVENILNIADLAAQKTASGTPISSSQGVLSIIFDDGYTSGFGTVKPMFEARGIRCGFAVNGINADGGDASKFMTAAQLIELEKAGFEIGNHTWGNTSLTTSATPVPTAETEIRTNAKWLRSLGLKCPFFVAVSSVLDPAYDEILKLDHAFAFTTFTGGNWGDNAKTPLPISDPYDVRRSSANTLYTGAGNTLARLYATVDALRDSGGIVFLYDHDPDNAAGNPASLPAADWATFLDYAIAQGVRIEAPSVAFDLVSSTQIKGERLDQVRRRANRSINASRNLLRDAELTSYGLTSGTDWTAEITSASGAFSFSKSGVGFEQPLQLNLTGGGWAVDDEVFLKNRTASFDSLERLGLLQFALDLSSGSSGVNTNWAITVGVNILDAVTPATVLATSESAVISINSRKRRFSVPDGITLPSYANGVIVEVFLRVRCLVSASEVALPISKPKLEINDDPTAYIAGRPAIKSTVLAGNFTEKALGHNVFTKLNTSVLAGGSISANGSGTFTVTRTGVLHIDATVKVDPAAGANSNGSRLIMCVRMNGLATNINPQESTGVGTRLTARYSAAISATAGDTFEIYFFHNTGSTETNTGGGIGGANVGYSAYSIQHTAP